MKVLVTGVTGFIGSALAYRLIASGHEVVGLSRDREKARESLPVVKDFYAWPHDGQLSPSLLATVDAVVNLGGESVAGRWTKSKKERIYESRITGTRNLVNAMRNMGHPGVLVNASAVGFYGDRGEEELTEASGAGEGFLACVCDAWEAEALQANSDGIRATVMRLGIVLGQGGGALKPMLPLFRVGLGGPLGGGRQWWPWVHIDDAVSALIAAIERPHQGVYNLASPNPARQKDFAKALGSVLHRPAFMPAPTSILRLTQGEFADELLFSKRVLPERLQMEGFRFEHPDLSEALDHILAKREVDEDVLARA